MTASRDPDRLIRAFLDEGDEYLQDQVYDEVRAAIEHRRQRVYFGPRRTPIMNRIVTFGLGAAAVVVVGLLLGSQLLGEPTNLGGPSEPTATPMVTATPQPSDEPTSTPQAGLPEGPFLVNESPYEDAPSITMTIPASGWTHLAEYSSLLKGGEDPLPEAWVITDSYQPGTGISVYGDPCQWASTRPETPATSVDEIIAALAAQASRDASEPVDVTVGGYAGKMITLHVPEDADFADCDDRTFATYEVPELDPEPWQWHQGPGQVDEFWFVEVEGAIIGIRITYLPDNAELLEEMRSLLESTTFQFP